MKLKYILFFFTFLCVFSTALAANFSGKITNATEQEVVIAGLNFKSTITVNADGTFSKDLDLKHNGIYMFVNGSNRWEMYLTPNSILQLNFDEKNIDQTLTYTGNTADESLYLFQKSKLYDSKNFDAQKTYSLDEEDYVKVIDQLVITNLELLKKSNITDAFFRKSEEKNIIFNAQSFYHNFKFMHSYYKKSSIPKDKICESRLFNKDTIQFSFDEFLFSSVFRGYVNGRFVSSFNPKFKKNPSDAQEIIKTELSSINNPVIEDFILKSLALQQDNYNDKEHFIIKAIIALTKDEEFKNQLHTKLENIGKFVAGSPAPIFQLNDQNGNTVSLSDFKGKNIYIDFWATWCKPCVAEIPDLKKLEEKFKNKNIVFLSISLDSQKDIEKWKNLIIKKDLKGTQLIVENAWQSEVVNQYLIESIPRFILIDTDGNLVDINAPRPSMSKVTKAINRLDNL